MNYRGSIGYGSDFVTKLPGKCGDVDVSDCLKVKDSKTNNSDIFWSISFVESPESCAKRLMQFRLRNPMMRILCLAFPTVAG